MIDRNSPLLDQLAEAAKNASNQDREYWADLFRMAQARIAKADALAERVRILGSCLHPLEDEDNLKAVFSASTAYREGSDT